MRRTHDATYRVKHKKEITFKATLRLQDLHWKKYHGRPPPTEKLDFTEQFSGLRRTVGQSACPPIFVHDARRLSPDRGTSGPPLYFDRPQEDSYPEWHVHCRLSEHNHPVDPEPSRAAPPFNYEQSPSRTVQSPARNVPHHITPPSAALPNLHFAVRGGEVVYGRLEPALQQYLSPPPRGTSSPRATTSRNPRYAIPHRRSGPKPIPAPVFTAPPAAARHSPPASRRTSRPKQLPHADGLDYGGDGGKRSGGETEAVVGFPARGGLVIAEALASTPKGQRGAEVGSSSKGKGKEVEEEEGEETDYDLDGGVPRDREGLGSERGTFRPDHRKPAPRRCLSRVFLSPPTTADRSYNEPQQAKRQHLKKQPKKTRPRRKPATAKKKPASKAAKDPVPSEEEDQLEDECEGTPPPPPDGTPPPPPDDTLPPPPDETLPPPRETRLPRRLKAHLSRRTLPRRVTTRLSHRLRTRLSRRVTTPPPPPEGTPPPPPEGTPLPPRDETLPPPPEKPADTTPPHPAAPKGTKGTRGTRGIKGTRGTKGTKGSRNPDAVPQPPPKAPQQKSEISEAEKATMKLNRELKAKEKEEYLNEVAAFDEILKAKAQELAERFDKKVDVVKKALRGNQHQSRTRAEDTTPELQRLLKEAPEYQDMTEEEEALLLNEHAEFKGVKKSGTRLNNAAASRDVTAFTRRIEGEVEALHRRTGAIAFFAIGRSSVNDTIRPVVTGTTQVFDYFPQVLRTTTEQFAIRFDNWTCNKDQVAVDLSYQTLRRECTGMILEGLERKINKRHGYELQGWPDAVDFMCPSNLGTVKRLRPLYEALMAGSCWWEPLSGARKKELQEAVAAKGPKANKDCVDKGTSREAAKSGKGTRRRDREEEDSDDGASKKCHRTNLSGLTEEEKLEHKRKVGREKKARQQERKRKEEEKAAGEGGQKKQSGKRKRSATEEDEENEPVAKKAKAKSSSRKKVVSRPTISNDNEDSNADDAEYAPSRAAKEKALKRLSRIRGSKPREPNPTSATQIMSLARSTNQLPKSLSQIFNEYENEDEDEEEESDKGEGGSGGSS
ncbi:hypothetical protein C8F04DRAFT_1179335 [Mycena alexandri]|uniref:Uncharacterized protein n=1 Tax=Mycena alexandri TaxID=1745969 RepID=A0AAD6X712_9AGAR|nr:hypothetical protein C8F04DRAFT_1179335 [Mycena alexandri]